MKERLRSDQESNNGKENKFSASEKSLFKYGASPQFQQYPPEMKKVKKYGKIVGNKNNERTGKTGKDSPTTSPLIPTAVPTLSPVPFPTSLPTESPTLFLRLSQEKMGSFCSALPCLDHFIFDEENEQYQVVTTATIDTIIRLNII
eukprot:snap_masked-scaffold_8-processed-gene-11.24-mRNA-1 protein AED:1.00 eAED:1.00 QI:0/0/0/0/1/1/3/0/145